MSRTTLISDLLRGDRKLQSITANDLNAAQFDLRHLKLRQLLRLRVLHIGYTPSGTGSDAVSTLGGAHSAFMSVLDHRLFEQLGRAVVGDLQLETGDTHVGVATPWHRIGRDAVFLAAGAAGINSPSWWSWQLSATRQVFFHASSFKLVDDFPETGGVLVASDCSKPDTCEPTGTLRWFDWRVCHVMTWEELEAKTQGTNTFSHCLQNSADQPSGAVSSPGGPPSSQLASTLSVTMLTGLRSGLRKTERRKSYEVDVDVGDEEELYSDDLEATGSDASGLPKTI